MGPKRKTRSTTAEDRSPKRRQGADGSSELPPASEEISAKGVEESGSLSHESSTGPTTRSRRKAAETANEKLTTRSAPSKSKKATKREQVSTQATQKESKKETPTEDPKDSNTSSEGKSDGNRNYWLVKAEPESRLEKGVDVKFSIDDLKEKGVSTWDGVRNHEAKNILRDKMKPGIAGIAEVVREGYPDFTAFDPKHPYYDPKSEKDKPKWYMVDVKYVRHLKRFVSLRELQQRNDKELSDMALLRRGRLSVQPVKEKEFNFILELSEQPDPHE
ncbi:Thymocyte nuclear protein 1 [Quaeritorhiza haematococci]|nr:Thymocyte nuclear protein 1 [Quaeritorhiza haematococci]